MAENLFSQKMDINEIVLKIEQTYPYQLNYQKKMGILFKELTDDIKYLEIKTAPKLRAKTLWIPHKKFYQSYLDILIRLQE